MELSDSELVQEVMRFYTYYDFCDNRKKIKKAYKKLSKRNVDIYKLYVYANIHMRETFKNAIWDYLNDFDDGSELVRLKQYYKAK